ncbi:SPOR domain-containing protein [Butyrivibrio sp. LC3010]|uniref:SPOR domain-containing protein n=1 Tax=Butyrivibrio sp. LC3010 TaxID=1280680 RepID=UPI000407C1E6|nr:SPOR domain-containing protein [Butyrivibrio sp. LC3010]
MKKNAVLLVLMVTLMITSGCSKAAADAGTKSSFEAPSKVLEDTSELEPLADKPQEVSPDDVTLTEDVQADDNGFVPGKNGESASTAPVDAKLSLSKRLCGKYSCKSSEGEYYILDIYEFADNLYAHVGISEDDEDSDYLGAYTFWGAELIPDDKDVAKNQNDNVFVCNILAFSIMSNMGKYQSAPDPCKLVIADNGIDFTGAFFSEKKETLHFEHDNRVEDAFPYMFSDEAGTGNPSEKMIGIWREKDSDSPLYVEYGEKGMFKIYRETPGIEVFFAGGEYHFIDGDKLCGTYSILGSGSMPMEYEAQFDMKDDDTIELDFIYDNSLLKDGKSHMVLEKIDADDVPFVTMDMVREVLTDDYNYDAYTLPSDHYDDGFYGVWIGAYKNLEDAQKLAQQIEDQGAIASVVFSPEWENLNSQPFYCVTYDRFETESSAEGALVNAKTSGYDIAYIKFSGKRVMHRIYYTVYSHDVMDFSKDQVVLSGVSTTSLMGDDEKKMTLIIDKDTTFDSSCDMSFFGNYEKGQSVLEWFLKNDELTKSDPDSYSSGGPALLGIFDVAITGDHVDRFYGSYWWD